MNSLLAQHVLDVDFKFLEGLSAKDRWLALLELVRGGRTSWLEIALILDAGDNPDLLEKIQPPSAIQTGSIGMIGSKPPEIDLS